MRFIFSTDPAKNEKWMHLISANEPIAMQNAVIKNIYNFYDFIYRHVKSDYVNFENYLHDVINEARIGEFYELRGVETNSGNSESISFKVTYDYDEASDEVKNYTITF